MPVMAEVDTFTSMNGSQNIGLHEEFPNCDGGDPCKLSQSVISQLDGKVGNEIANVTQQSRQDSSTCGHEACLPTQNGDDSQMEIPRVTVALDADQTSSTDSLDPPISLGNDKDSKKEYSNVENQDCDATSNCSSKNTVQDATCTQGSKQESGFPLPVIASLANSGTASPYFTRSAKKARLTNSVADETIAAESTTCSPTSAASSKPLTTFAIMPPQQNSESATTTNSVPSVQDALVNSGIMSPYFTRSATKASHLTSAVPHEALTVQNTTCLPVTSGTPTTGGVADSSKLLTTSTISLHQNNESAPIIDRKSVV